MYRYLMIALIFGCQGEKPKTSDPVKSKAESHAVNRQAVPPTDKAGTAEKIEATTPPKKATNGATLSEAEAKLIWPTIADLRAGVRPFAENSVGICRCNGPCGKTCDEFLGLDVKNPPPGKYQVWAALKTPQGMPESMRNVDFEYKCTTLKKRKNGESKTESSGKRGIRVGTSNKNHGFRLSRTREFKSPSKSDEVSCNWSYTFHNLGGDKVIKGSYVLTNRPPPAPDVSDAGVPAPAAVAIPSPLPERPAGPLVLSAAEYTALGDSLDDLRGGIRPFDDQSVGICRCNGACTKKCDEFIGLVADKPPEGRYQVRAALHTPRLMPKDELKVAFEHTCEVTVEAKNRKRTSTNSYNKTFEIGMSNRKHGYRLTQLKTFKSPINKGRHHCTWRFKLPGVGGEKIIEGSYTLEPVVGQ